MRRQDITRFYTVLENEGQIVQPTIGTARAFAASEQHIWFVREGDKTWDVEPYHGQFVNCLGFMVTAEPCRPAHADRIFKY